jgi:tRNA(fMet)-specific endonuclease VapC
LEARYRPILNGNELAISFMTIAELYEGAYREDWAEKRWRKLERTIGYYAVFHSTISAEDAWIAATALTYECPLVTHNPQDFKDIPRLRILTAQVLT